MSLNVRGVRIERAGQGGRFYVWKRNRYWSVTTILSGGLPKPVLVNWAAKVTAEYAIENLDVLYAMAKKDPKEATDWLKGAKNRSRDRAANLGTLVHEAAESHVLGKPYPSYTPEQAPFMDAYKRWIDDFDPAFISVEASVFSDQYNYAGTLDAIADIDGVRWLIDFKTGKSGPWPEVALQLAAYRYAQGFIGLPDDSPADIPKVDACAVVKIRPEGVKFYPVVADEDIHRYFLYVRETFRFTEEVAKSVIGDEWQPDSVLERQLAQSLKGVAPLAH